MFSKKKCASWNTQLMIDMTQLRWLENEYVELTCSSNSTSAPDLYSKLVNLSYNWFVNDTKMDNETRETLSLYVTRKIKYNRLSCTTTEEGLESDRSYPVQINPLCKFDVTYPLCNFQIFGVALS